MTRNYSQFVFELLPARRLHTGHPTAMNRSPQRPDELIRRIINKIRIVFATTLGVECIKVGRRRSITPPKK